MSRDPAHQDALGDGATSGPAPRTARTSTDLVRTAISTLRVPPCRDLVPLHQEPQAGVL